MAFCSKCGAAIEPDVKFCDKCGQPQDVAEQQPGPAQEQAPPPVVNQQPDPAQWQAPPPGVNQQPDPAQWQAPPGNAYQQPDPAQWQAPPGNAYQQPAPAQWQAPPGNAYQQPNPAQWQAPPYGANQPYPNAPPPYQPTQPIICSIPEIYRRVMSILQRKPILLWGISLMFSLLTFIAIFFCWLPIIYVPVVAVLEFGMISVFLAGYRGQKFETAMLFTGFNDFKRVAGGMLWMMLWILIWALIPIVGIVFAVIKAYSYRFVPYLLLTDPEIKATDTLKRSIAMTQGYKGKMFLADFLIGIIIGIAMAIILGLAQIPTVGIIFYVIYVIIAIIVGIFLPLIAGLISAAFFDEIERVQQ